MKKHLLFYLVFVLLAINARAQNSTVVTIASNSTSAISNGPIVMDAAGPNYLYSRHIAIYQASSINATPFSQRVLTKIAWYKDDTVQFNTPGGSLKIYVKQTTATSTGGLSGANWTTEIQGATEVANISDPKISGGTGWKQYSLTTPIIWDGTSNLEIFVDWVGAGTVTKSRLWRYSPGQTNASATMVAQSPIPSGIPVNNVLPNIQLTFNSYINDAGITTINAPVSPVTAGVSTPVTATIKNFGTNNITSAIIGWNVNGIVQPDYALTGNLTPGATNGPLTLGNYTFLPGVQKLKAYIKTVNGGPDPLAINDSSIVDLVVCSALSGTNYTINKNAPASGTNFPSFTALAQVLNSCGVSGPTTITVAPNSGPYNEFFSLVNIPGTSSTNTITIEGSGNTIASANEAVVKLDRANYVKINNLIITQNNPTSLTSYGLQLIGPSNYVTISNNTINMPMMFGNGIVGILAGTTLSGSGNFCNNATIQNNTINGGNYGMRINGTSGSPTPTGALNNQVINNQFKDFYNWGIYFSNNNGTIVDGNDFSRPTRTDAAGFSAIAIATGSVNCVVSKNRFHNTHDLTTSRTTTVIGVQVDANPAVGLENMVKNNVFYNLNNEGIITIFNVTGSGVHIYHNTISIENPARPASNTSNIRALYISSAGNNVKFINNIVNINMPGTGNKAAVWLSSATTSFISNNNVLHIASGLINAYTGYLTTGKATLTDWRAVNTTTPYDLNSVDFHPVYTSLATGNLKPTSPDVNDIGQPSPVTDDVIGVLRSATFPDPGAYEFDLGNLDAGISGLASPLSPTAPGVSTPVTVNLKNFGTAILTGATIGWKIDGVMQPAFTWTGNIASNATTPVTLGNFTFVAGNHVICAWTTGPNGGLDINTANDSTCTTISACLPLAGNYTIDKTGMASATNFVSFDAAATRLHECGVSGPVTINVISGTGPYNEQVEFLSIPGASAISRVTIQGNANTLTAIPDINNNTVLRLNNADYLTINNLNITIGGPGTPNGPVVSAVQILNNSDNDTISNCTVTMPFTNTVSAYFMGIYAGTTGASFGSPDFDIQGNYTNNTVFLNNTIIGGLYGIKINGEIAGPGNTNNRIIGNVLLDQNAYGIAILHAKGCLVEGNEINRPTLSSPNNMYAIRMDGTSLNNRISKNQIHDLWGGLPFMVTFNQTAYGIYSSGAGAPAGSENIVSNNICQIVTPSSNSNVYGIYNLSNSGIYYYYNTINVSGQGYATGFYQLNTATNIKFINNNVSINATGLNNKYAIHLSTGNSNIQSNNNNLHVDSPAGSFIGKFETTDCPSFASWKLANGNAYDQNSVSADPYFLNATGGNLIPVNPALNNMGLPIAAVTSDITGATRSTTTPDVGAHEFTPVLDDVGVIALVSPTNGCGLTNQEPVTVTIKNFGATTQNSIPVSYRLNNGSVVNGTYTGSLAFNATANFTFPTKINLSVQGAYALAAFTKLPGDTKSTNDTTSATINNAVQATLPAQYNFESAGTGLNALGVVTKANATVTEGVAASFGPGSTKGLIMDGIDNATWVVPVGVTDPWITNPNNLSGAYICLSTAGVTDSLWLTFDLKQLFKASNANTNFRVTVNGTQVGPTYRPPFSGSPIAWQPVKVNLTAYKNLPIIQIGLESNVKEGFDNGNGTANLIDNIMVKKRIINGIKSIGLADQIYVFPNPGNGLFNVNLPVGKNYQLEVTDLTGKVLRQTTARGNTVLHLEGMAKGVYLLKVSGENGLATRKLIVD